jgi:hypothetical protein
MAEGEADRQKRVHLVLFMALWALFFFTLDYVLRLHTWTTRGTMFTVAYHQAAPGHCKDESYLYHEGYCYKLRSVTGNVSMTTDVTCKEL